MPHQKNSLEWKLTRAQAATLRRAASILAAIREPAPDLFASGELEIDDVAQIRPGTDPTFAGMLLRVCDVQPYAIRGYLLRPHRGGGREAWYSFHHHDLERIGKAIWPEPKWATRPW